MARVIVNDASCLIDLRKGRLLRVLCGLPNEFIVPLPVRFSNILDSHPYIRAKFIRGDFVAAAAQVYRKQRAKTVGTWIAMTSGPT